MIIKVTTLLLVALSTSFAFSQTFNVIPNDSVVEVMDIQETQVFYIYQSVINPNDEINLKVRVIQNTIPQEWDGMFCVYGSCTGQFAPVGVEISQTVIQEGTDGYGRLTVSPSGAQGTGVYQAYVYDENFPSDGDTITWVITAQDLTSIFNQKVQSFELYPNPTSEYATISLASSSFQTIEILNCWGQVVYREDLEKQVNNKTLNLQGLKPGQIYMVRIIDTEGLKITKKLYIK